MTSDRSGSPPAVVVLLAVAHALLALTYALLTPAYQGPDESQHVDMVVAAAEWESWPDVGERTLSRQVRSSQYVVALQPRKQPRAAADAPPRDERPSLEDLEDPDRPTSGINHINQHPPLYYTVLNAWTGVVVSFSPVDLSAVDRTVFVMRAAGAVVAAGVVLLAWLMATAAGLPRRSAVMVATVPLAVPMLTYVLGSVNNDVLLVGLGAALTARLVPVLRGDLSTRSSVVVGVLAGLAAATKILGALSVPMIVLATLWAPADARSRLLYLVRTGAISFVAGGWWWLRNMFVEGTLQPNGLGHIVRTGVPDPDVVTWVRMLDLRLWQGFFGRFGNLNTPIPRWLLVVLTALVVAAVVVAARRAVRRRSPFDERLLRRLVVVATLPLVVVVTTFVARSALRYATSGVLLGPQGRYTFVSFLGIALVVGIGVAAMRRPFPLALPVAVLLAHAGGAYALLRRFWGESGGGVRESLAAFVAWSPLEPEVTIPLVMAAGIVLAAAMSLVARELLEPPMSATDGRGAPTGRRVSEATSEVGSGG